MTSNRTKWTIAIALAAVLFAGWGISWACDKAAETAKGSADAKPCCAKMAAAVAANGQVAPAAGAPCGAKPAVEVAAAEGAAPCPMHAAKMAAQAEGGSAPCPMAKAAAAAVAQGETKPCGKPAPAAVAQNAPPAAEPR